MGKAFSAYSKYRSPSEYRAYQTRKKGVKVKIPKAGGGYEEVILKNIESDSPDSLNRTIEKNRVKAPIIVEDITPVGGISRALSPNEKAAMQVSVAPSNNFSASLKPIMGSNYYRYYDVGNKKLIATAPSRYVMQRKNINSSEDKLGRNGNQSNSSGKHNGNFNTGLNIGSMEVSENQKRQDAFAKRTDKLTQRQDKFFSSGYFKGTELLSSKLTLGGGYTPINERGWFGKFSQTYVKGFLDAPVALPASVYFAGGKLAAVSEAATIKDSRKNIPQFFGQGFKDIKPIYDIRTPEGASTYAFAATPFFITGIKSIARGRNLFTSDIEFKRIGKELDAIDKQSVPFTINYNIKGEGRFVERANPLKSNYKETLTLSKPKIEGTGKTERITVKDTFSEGFYKRVISSNRRPEVSIEMSNIGKKGNLAPEGMGFNRLKIGDYVYKEKLSKIPEPKYFEYAEGKTAKSEILVNPVKPGESARYFGYTGRNFQLITDAGQFSGFALSKTFSEARIHKPRRVFNFGVSLKEGGDFTNPVINRKIEKVVPRFGKPNFRADKAVYNFDFLKQKGNKLYPARVSEVRQARGRLNTIQSVGGEFTFSNIVTEIKTKPQSFSFKNAEISRPEVSFPRKQETIQQQQTLSFRKPSLKNAEYKAEILQAERLRRQTGEYAKGSSRTRPLSALSVQSRTSFLSGKNAEKTDLSQISMPKSEFMQIQRLRTPQMNTQSSRMKLDYSSMQIQRLRTPQMNTQSSRMKLDYSSMQIQRLRTPQMNTQFSRLRSPVTETPSFPRIKTPELVLPKIPIEPPIYLDFKTRKLGKTNKKKSWMFASERNYRYTPTVFSIFTGAKRDIAEVKTGLSIRPIRRDV